MILVMEVIAMTECAEAIVLMLMNKSRCGYIRRNSCSRKRRNRIKSAADDFVVLSFILYGKFSLLGNIPGSVIGGPESKQRTMRMTH